MAQIFRIAFLLFVFSGCAFGQNKKDDKGRRQGYWIIYGIDRPQTGYADSTKVEEGNYIDDRKEGIWKKYNSDGSVRITGEYRNNRAFAPQVQIRYSSGKVKETSDCGYSKEPRLPQPKTRLEKFVPPHVKNEGDYVKYIAPKFKTIAYFPLLYLGDNKDSIETTYLSWVYPPEDVFANEISHTRKLVADTTPITSKNLLIKVIPDDVLWVAQPASFGQDTMEYFSAASVILFNCSDADDTLMIAKDMVLNLKLQYLDGETWKELNWNPAVDFLLPEMKGNLLLYPGEIVVTAIPLYEGEHRRLRIVMGEAVSEEFEISNNWSKSEY